MVTANVNLSTTLGTGAMYAGFTASNGMFVADQDVLSWSLTQ